MKTLRKIIFILLGISLLLLVIIKLFHITVDTAYGSCTAQLCTDSVRTNYWGIAAYAGLGLSFILATVLTLVLAIWRVVVMIKRPGKK